MTKSWGSGDGWGSSSDAVASTVSKTKSWGGGDGWGSSNCWGGGDGWGSSDSWGGGDSSGDGWSANNGGCWSSYDSGGKTSSPCFSFWGWFGAYSGDAGPSYRYCPSHRR